MFELQIITLATVLAVALGGLSMGVYIAVANKFRSCTPSPVSLLVLGWSFLLPLGLTQMLTTGEVEPQRVIERMVLWAIFSFSASVASRFSKEWYWTRRKG